MAPSAPEPSAAAQAALRRRGLSLIAHLRARDTHSIFLDPVTGVPHYRTIVKRPMCLSVAEANLKAGQYKTPAKLASALNLIWSNAMLFNSPETIFHQQAAALKEVAHRGLEELRAALAREGFYVNTPSRRTSLHSHHHSEDQPSSARPPRPPPLGRSDGDDAAGILRRASSQAAQGGSTVSQRPRDSTEQFRKAVPAPPPVKPPPIREVDIFVGPKAGASTEHVSKKRPRSAAREYHRSLHDSFVRSSAALSRRLLASLLDPAVVAKADREAAAAAVKPEPSQHAPVKAEEHLVAVPTTESNEEKVATEEVKKTKKQRLSSSLTLGSSKLDIRVRQNAHGVDFRSGHSSRQEAPEVPPNPEDIEQVKALLAQHDIGSQFMNTLLSGDASSASEGLFNPGKTSQVSEDVVHGTGNFAVPSSRGCVPGRTDNLQLTGRPSSPSARKGHDLQDILDENHDAIMAIRRARAEAECETPTRRVELIATERFTAKRLGAGISAVAQKLPPVALARPVDVARTAISFAGVVANCAKTAEKQADVVTVSKGEAGGTAVPLVVKQEPKQTASPVVPNEAANRTGTPLLVADEGVDRSGSNLIESGSALVDTTVPGGGSTSKAVQAPTVASAPLPSERPVPSGVAPPQPLPVVKKA